LDGSNIVKYIEFIQLQWAGHVVRMHNSGILKNCRIENFVEETCGKTTTEMGRQYYVGITLLCP